jgi:hypothetical protein
MDTQFLTSEGRRRVLSQLEFLRTVKRVEVAQHLREVVEAGDFVGNAVYEDVKGESEYSWWCERICSPQRWVTSFFSGDSWLQLSPCIASEADVVVLIHASTEPINQSGTASI